MADAVRTIGSPLPATGFLRQRQILGDKNANPPIPAILPISKTSWWEGIGKGKYPRPIKLGPRTTAWRAEDIRAMLDRITSEAAT